MHGGAGYLRPRPGPRGAALGFPPPHTAYSVSNPYLQNPNPSFFHTPGNPYFQHPNLYFQHPPLFAAPEPPPPPPGVAFPTPSSSHASVAPSPSRAELREKVERAVAKTHRDCLAAGESVSAWKVSQSALMALQIDSWSSLGFPMQDVPALYRLMVTEGKINAYIHCFVGARRITSIYDLDAAICQNEGIEKFEELGLGPLLRHPLVGHYFSVPADETKNIKISSEEIVCALAEFISPNMYKKVQAEDFLDFLAKKLCATREKLGIRLQSFGFLIGVMKAAKKTERMAFDKYVHNVKSSVERTKEKMNLVSESPEILSQKQALDKRFKSISERVKKFSSMNVCSLGKHIRYASSGSEEIGTEDNVEDLENDEHNSGIHCQSTSQNMKETDHRVSNCPYPSQSEEISRLRCQVGIDGGNSASGKSNVCRNSITKKRKFEDPNSSLKSSCKLANSDKVGIGDLSESSNNKKQHPFIDHDNNRKSLAEEAEEFRNNRFVIDRNSMETFVGRWGRACKEHSVIEVLDKMMDYYDLKARKRRKMLTVFSSFPALGLVNVALMSMKSGLWSSCFTSLDVNDDPGPNPLTSAHQSEAVDNALSNLNESASGIKYSISAGEIIEKIKTYLELDHNLTGEGKTSLQKHLIFFKKFHECEIWLSKQFSVKHFSCFGHGEYFEFLEKYIFMIPSTLLECLVDDQCDNLLEASMSEKQLLVLLSQATHDVGENIDFHNAQISSLLKKQFPMISFKMKGNSSKENLLKIIRKQVDISSSVLFSAILLSDACKGESLVVSERGIKENFESERVGCLGSMSSSDALKCLLKAPILSDLRAWSHWDLIYAPSLGPLLEWLLAEVRTEHLACILMKDGKLIRIDPSVTVDSVMEALLIGSSYKTAVNLVSLLSLYRGTNNVPISLLKCYAVQAMDVIIKNYIDTTGTKIDGGNCMQKTMLYIDQKGKSEYPKNFSLLNEALAVASKFILDCLNQIPFEFRSYAASILLYALQSFTKDAPGIILRECSEHDQLLMLHDIGLSLGIKEWIENYRLFGSGAAASLSLTTESNKACGSPLVIIKPSPVQHAIMDSEMASFEEVTSFLDGNGTYGELKENEMEEVFIEKSHESYDKNLSENNQETEAIRIIELIRKEEFGLDSNLDPSESSLLKKQHARLGRALHCLSQELYSQNSHLILELVQNADDNIYPENVEPTLIFILQATGIVVLNNEWGFSAQNIRALCDVGNSTKKGSGTGYIGQKGIGFKSVFRVTDAPEIHSNGFHVKFDLSEGQIGFVLPTVISPCDVHSFTGHMSSEANHINAKGWNTCIVLPFRSKLNEGTGIGSVVSMFSDLHPSLLLFLHRLQCIMLKNVMNDSLIIMRKEMVGNGIVKVSDGSKNMNWLVSRKKLQADVIRPDVLTTEIAVAFTLQESDNGVYQPHLEQQPVFAFLPLRTYGLKFILQGDFVLPSSREEVDGDSAWNQWLLSEFPSLFTDAEKSFCGLPCYKNSPGRAVTAYMSFVPLVGEVHGFFSHLPRMIISKLRVSNCLLLEGPDMEWVPPCRVLRGWDDHAGNLLSESLLHQHLGLGYLNKDIFLSDSLAKALGVQDYGPKTLIDIISSVCAKDNGIKSLGLDWLSYWLIALSTAVSVNSSKPQAEVEYDPCSRLKKIPFIPLSDGSYGSLVDGPIWLPCDAAGNKSEGEHNPEYFTYLHAKLRTVDPLLTAGTKIVHTMDDTHVAMITRMLVKIGVQQLSAHEIITSHILPAMSSNLNADIDKHLVTDYLSFVMFHLQSHCSCCQVEKAGMILELQRKAIVLTNSGFRRPFDDSIHFSKAFGNFIDVEKLINTNSIQWHEVDAIYLKHPSTRKLPSGCEKWRDFFELLGVTDFIRVIHVDKKLMNLSSVDSANAMWEGGDLIFSEMVLEDWESPELVHLLSNLSLNKCQGSCMYLVEILDKMWDDNFSTKATSACILKLNDEKRLSESSFVKGLRNFKWISSSMDGELHYPRDLFYKSEAVYSILGDIAPYAVPQVRSQLLLTALGLKTQVTLNDALALFQQWRMSGVPIRASIAQMSKFYTFVWNEIRSSERKLEEFRSGPSIFLPFVCGLTHDDIVCGQLLSPDEVYWHDPTGCIERTKQLILQNSITQGFLNRTLVQFYPGLNDFFVNECGVREIPPSSAYLQIIQNLASMALPSQAANAVFHVLSKWADDIKSGLCTPEEISYLKQCLQKIENAMLPTVQDRWVSLHSSFGLVCWSDDEDLRKQFKHSMSIDFLHFGELNDEEKRMLSEKMSGLMQALGIPALSEVISREAIFYGMEDCTEKASLVNWILPYAQRYIYVLHPSRYSHLKKFEYERLHQLQVAVVEKLYYRHTIKGCDSTTNKRFECNCLLQGNTLYVTRTSDTHSIFMELSRFFFGGFVDLQFANFLHMVTTMAESGSTEEQTEFFIVNSQKVQKLPESESTWNLSCLLPACEDRCHFANTLPIATENTSKQKPKLGIVSNWPPTNWKTAPDFRYARQNHYRRAPVTPPGGPLLYGHAPITERDVSTEDWQVPTEIDDDLITADRQDAANHLPLQSLRTTDESVRHNSAIYVDRRLLSDPKTLNVPSTSGSGHESGTDISTFTTRDQLLVGLPTESQAMKIGRLGELVAYKYFVEKMGSTAVKWVNQETETGLPFDLVIGDNEENKEYIEVKATKSMTKDWFTISTREWQFAVERGNSYSVAHIILGDSKRAKVTILKNPVKLCQQSLLQLVILMQKQQ